MPITFTPTLPGGRKDALFLMNGSTRVATVLLFGVGQSPMAEIEPGVVTDPLSNASYYIYDSAVDENGTVYYLATEQNAVYSLTKAGVNTQLPITGLNSPRSIAIDGAGVLYISDQTFFTTGTTPTPGTLTTYDTVQGTQGAIALPVNAYYQFSNVDGIGDLFVESSANNSIYEFLPNGTSTNTVISPAITQPSDSALDSAGNLFIGGYSINELAAGGTQTEINSAGGASGGMGVDAADTVYATRYTNYGGVAQLAASNYSTPLATLDSSAAPTGFGLGSDGTLWVGNYSNLDKVDRTQGAIAFGEQTQGVASAAQNVTIYNSGNQPLSISGIAIAGTGFTEQAAPSNGCTTSGSIAPGALCLIAVTLTPPNSGVFNGTLTVTTNSLNNSAGVTQSVALSGFVYGAYLTEAPNPVAFPNQAAGTTSDATQVTLTNNGDLYNGCVGTGSITAPTGFAVTAGTCTSQLTPAPGTGSSCQLNVTFSPPASQTASSQLYSGSVTVPYTTCSSSGNYSVSFNVNGTGVLNQPVAALTPATFTFPSQTVNTTSSATTFMLANSGNASLTGIAPSIAGANPADFALATGTNACGATLAAGSSCFIYVTFTPASATTFNALLSIADNASSSPQTSTLNGTGTPAPAPVAALTPATFTFPSQTVNTTSSATTFMLANSGNASLTGIAPSIAGANPSDFALATGTNACGATLAAGSSCFIYVTFTPASATGFTATLSVADNASSSPQTSTLSGSGTTPPAPDFSMSATPPSQTVAAGGEASFVISVAATNGGFNQAVSLSVSGLPAGATGTFLPASITPGSGSGNSTLTVQLPTTETTAARRSGWPPAAPFLSLAVLLPLVGWRKRIQGVSLFAWVALLSLGAALGLAGCGGGFGLTQQSTSYTLTVTGASGTDIHTTTVQLTVK